MYLCSCVCLHVCMYTHTHTDVYTYVNLGSRGFSLNVDVSQHDRLHFPVEAEGRGAREGRAPGGLQHEGVTKSRTSQSAPSGRGPAGQPPREGGGCYGFRRRLLLLPSRAPPSSCWRNAGAVLMGVCPGQPLPLGFIFTPGDGRAARRVLGSRELQVLQA